MANYKKQMEMFDLGGLKDQGETVDRKSRNKVPVGSLKKEVRDDVPINISEGEFILPADVVRYHGLEKIMNMRQDAKAGLDMMNRMGQMGNSDQATLPDDIPFQPKNFQQGGINIQNPQIQNPQDAQFKILPMPDVQKTNQVPGVNFTAPGQLAMRPSVYSQTGQMPVVKPQPPKPPQVKVGDAPSYAPPAYRMPTGTAATPDFSKMIGAPFGQLQKTETKRYVNPDTGEELYIPFVNGEPVYPIPAGYIAEEKEKEEEKKEEAGEVKTTGVREEGGESSDVGVDTTSVTGGFYDDPQTFDYDLTEQELMDLAAGKTPSIQDFGKMSLRGDLKDPANVTSQTRGVSSIDKLGNFFSSVLGTAIGALTGGDKEKEISTSVQSERLGTLGYTTDKDKNSLANNLGIDFADLTTMARGHNAGNLNAADKNSVYSSRGVSVNVNKNDPNFGAVTGYTDAKAALSAVTDMAKAGYYGEIESITNMGGYAMSNPSLFSNMNKGRQALGLNTIDRDTAITSLNNITPTTSLGQPNYGQTLGPGTAVTANGVYTGGYFSMNNLGGKQVLGYTVPGRGTVFGDKGKGLEPPSVSIDVGKGISSISDTDVADPGGGAATPDPSGMGLEDDAPSVTETPSGPETSIDQGIDVSDIGTGVGATGDLGGPTGAGYGTSVGQSQPDPVDSTGDSTGGGPGCVIATHGLSTGGFTAMEKAKAELWCQKTYHGKWYGEAFRRGYRAAGMKHINAGTAPSVYQEFKDFVAYGRGIKKGWKIGFNYYLRTIAFFIHGLFIK